MPDSGRVVHVMGWRSQQYGSFERFLVALAGECRRRGADTHLVFNSAPASSDFLRDVEADVHAIPSPSSPFDPRFAARLTRLLARLRPSHVHVHFGVDAYQAAALARVMRVPRRFATKHITPGGADRPGAGLHHRWLAAQVERTFAVSRQVRADLLSFGVPPEEVEVAYLGIDTRVYRPDAAARGRTRAALGLEDATKALLATSHLRPGKGVEGLPELAARLRGSHPEAVLLLAGDGELRGELEAEIARRGLDGRLRLLGVREDVPDLLSAADLFLFPTTGGEGLPLGPLEALAAGVPVVASAVSDLPQLLGGTAELVAPGDVDALAAACERLLSEDTAARREAGIRLIEDGLTVQAGAGRHADAYGLPVSTSS